MLLRVGPLPDDPLTAAAQFHAEVLPRLMAALDEGVPVLTLVFEPAGHPHRAWREAAIQTIARTRAPARINAIAADDESAITATEAFIMAAPGLTGQYLALDSHGAGLVVNPAP